MPRMVRKQIYIEPEQDALLKRRAAELGTTESALIRQGIEAIVRKPAAAPLDDAAWETALAFMEDRARTLPADDPPSPRTWTREDLYDDRWSRRLPG